MTARSSHVAHRPFGVRRALLWISVALAGIGILVAIAVANRTLAPATTDAPPVNLLAKGDAAPPFAVATTQGPFTLAAQSKPVLVEVFATWCPHCQHEVATLNRLYDRYGDRVAFVAISGSPYGYDRASPESLDDVLGFARFFHVRYPVAYDPTLGVAKNYLQGGYPTVAIVTRDKRIAYAGSGEIAPATLEAELRAVLAAR